MRLGAFSFFALQVGVCLFRVRRLLCLLWIIVDLRSMLEGSVLGVHNLKRPQLFPGSCLPCIIQVGAFSPISLTTSPGPAFAISSFGAACFSVFICLFCIYLFGVLFVGF